MKQVYVFFLSILFALPAVAQDDAPLENTWYLVNIKGDGDPPYFVDPIEPSISPYITINADLSFTGYAACNSFSGQFVELVPGVDLTLVSFERETNTCEFESHNDFETYYFYFWDFTPGGEDYYYYLISGPADSNAELSFGFGPNIASLYQLFPLSVQEQKLPSLKAYPNPVKNKFQLETVIDLSTAQVKLTSMNGLTLEVSLEADNSVDMSGLASGVYILSVESEGLLQQLRIVKQ